jgi:hypothetical protein
MARVALLTMSHGGDAASPAGLGAAARAGALHEEES